MPKRKLLMVVGAGASVDFGMPSVADVRAIISAKAQKYFPLAKSPQSNLFEHIEGVATTYLKNNVNGSYYTPPNFEDLLYVLFSFPTFFPAAANTSPLGAFLTPHILPDIAAPQIKQAGPNELRDLASLSVDAILDEFRRRCLEIRSTKAAELTQLKAFMEALRAEFDLAIVTLNYDDIIYSSVPGIETGFDSTTGVFDPARIFGRKNWECILHLHGSVYFDMQGGASGMHEIKWQPNLSGAFHQNSFGRNPSSSTEGNVFPMSSIVAGYGKTTQLLRQPFRTYYSELDRLVIDCDALLFAGYGFGDEHLNYSFKNFRDKSPRPVIVVGHAADDAMAFCGADLSDYSKATVEYVHTFKNDFRKMSCAGSHAPNTVAHLKAAQDFEISSDPNTPLSLWYNGMMAACRNPNKILSQLR